MPKKISHSEALERFETIWESVDCGITLVDAETREILDINPVAARMFGDDKSKIIGKRCHKFICPAEECSCPIMDKGQTVDRSERKFITSRGEILPIIKTVAKINYDGKTVLLESFTDISNLKAAEEQLRELEVAKQSSKAKSDFLSRMSHEIRTPMNAIIGMTKVAENTSDIDKLKYCLQNINTSSYHLLEIINDVLDMSKIEAGKLELDESPLNIEKILSRICGITLDMIEQKGLDFSIMLDPGMRTNFIGDETRLSQVLTNLLSNAIKFTPASGKIRLTINEIERKDDYSILRISVSDTGIGMSQSQINRLFNSFEQADTSISRKYGGTGLGLAISKSIVEKMHGKIWVEAAPNEGSTFTLEIKLKYNKNNHDSLSISHVEPGSLNVLVIDSNPETNNYFISVLDSFGINTDSAETGKEAILKTKQAKKPFDAIFLDYHLSDSDGIETAKKLKLENKDTIIIMTSFTDWNKIENKARSAGISRFIAKPLLPSSILDSINELVSKVVKHDKDSNVKKEIPDFKGVNILLAEDVEINRIIFQELFSNTHLNIDLAGNGKEAVKKFKENPDKYNMIFMDVQMPDMDGHEATKKIRSFNIGNAKKIPIIALTANVFQQDIDACLEIGMNDHLSKPIDMDEVIRKINQYR